MYRTGTEPNLLTHVLVEFDKFVRLAGTFAVNAQRSSAILWNVRYIPGFSQTF